MFHEWWTNPDALQKGSPLLVNDFRIHLVNGVFGNGTDEYPFYQLAVNPGKCYRLRMIATMGEDVGDPLHSRIPGLTNPSRRASCLWNPTSVGMEMDDWLISTSSFKLSF